MYLVKNGNTVDDYYYKIALIKKACVRQKEKASRGDCDELPMHG